MGWFIDPDEETVLIIWPDQRVQLLKGKSTLPTINGIDLALTVDQVMGWLTF